MDFTIARTRRFHYICGMVALRDLTGQRFGRLAVLQKAGSRHNRVRWICRCDCGTERDFPGDSLKSGHSRSCGCWNIESAVIRATTHGMTKTPLFSVWKGMLTRCQNPNSTSFKNYGGRGIKVCDRWMDFSHFYADMGTDYRKGLTIERRDNDKNYEPE